MKDFDLDDLFESDESAKKTEPAPVVQPKPVVVTQSIPMIGDRYPIDHVVIESRANGRVAGCFGVVGGMLVSLLIGLAIGWFTFRGRSDDIEPDTDPVSGAYVAIFYNDTDLDSYTKSQVEFLNSVNTANWLEEHHANWKKIDTEPLDVSKLEKPFQVMTDKHRSKEPWIVIASGKKFASEPIESNEQAMKLLQKWVK